MRERGAPPYSRIGAVERHRVARTNESREPRAARMFGQVDDQIVPASAQRMPEAQLGAQRGQTAALEPAVDGVHAADFRVSLEHPRGFTIDERVQLGRG